MGEGPLRVLALLKTSTGGQWIAPLMAGLQERGHEVLVLVPDPEGRLGQQLRARQIPVGATPSPAASRSPLRQVVAVRALRQIVRDWDPDVVNYHLYASALAGRFACRRLDARTVYMIPGPLYLEAPYIRWAERFLWRLDDHIICSSSPLYRAYSRLGVPAEKMSFVPYGADLDAFRPTTADVRLAARQALGLSPDAFVAVCVAYFYPPKRLVHRGKGLKGHEVILAAWREYQTAGGTGILLLVGGGFGRGGDSYRASLQRLAQSMGVGDSVRWIGYTEDIPPFYAAADLSVVASWSENYGSIPEASGAGVPTIATAVGGLPDLVIDGVTGWLVAPGDASALARGLTRAERLHREGGLAPIGQRARRLAEALVDRRQNVRDYCHVIEQAARRGRP